MTRRRLAGSAPTRRATTPRRWPGRRVFAASPPTSSCRRRRRRSRRPRWPATAPSSPSASPPSRRGKPPSPRSRSEPARPSSTPTTTCGSSPARAPPPSSCSSRRRISMWSCRRWGVGDWRVGPPSRCRRCGPRSRSGAPSPPGPTTPSARSATARLYPSVKPTTIADGLLTSLSDRTFRILSGRSRGDPHRRRGDHHPGHAAAVGAGQDPRRTVGGGPARGGARQPERFEGRRVGLILSGGNANLDRLPW